MRENIVAADAVETTSQHVAQGTSAATSLEEMLYEGLDGAQPQAAARPHLSPLTQELLIALARHEARDRASGISKRELSDEFGCCMKTIERGLAVLRRSGLIISQVRLDTTGAQLSSQHHVTQLAREQFADLL